MSAIVLLGKPIEEPKAPKEPKVKTMAMSGKRDATIKMLPVPSDPITVRQCFVAFVKDNKNYSASYYVDKVNGTGTFWLMSDDEVSSKEIKPEDAMNEIKNAVGNGRIVTQVKVYND